MRVKFAALVAVFLVFVSCPAGSSARGLGFSFEAANQFGAPGATLRYAGKVTNVSGVTLYLTFSSLTVLNDASASADDSVFFNAVTVPYMNGSPITLLNNATFTLPVFDLTLAPDAAPGAIVSGTFLLFADDSSDPANPGTSYSSVSEPPLLQGEFTAVISAAVAPEPPTAPLLGAGILALVGFVSPSRGRCGANGMPCG